MRHLITLLAFALAALLASVNAHAALRCGGTGQTTPRPTNPTPVPDAPVTSWQPPFILLR